MANFASGIGQDMSLIWFWGQLWRSVQVLQAGRKFKQLAVLCKSSAVPGSVAESMCQ